VHGSNSPATALALVSLPAMGIFTSLETGQMLYALGSRRAALHAAGAAGGAGGGSVSVSGSAAAAAVATKVL
jgi:hypothetical protein